MEVDYGGLSQQLGCPIFVVVLHPHWHNIGQCQAEFIIGHQFGTVCGVPGMRKGWAYEIPLIDGSIDLLLLLPIDRRLDERNTKEYSTRVSD